jgi:hypothetical protein
MPKLSHAQEVAALEETLVAARASAEIQTPKERQQACISEGKGTTEALSSIDPAPLLWTPVERPRWG